MSSSCLAYCYLPFFHFWYIFTVVRAWCGFFFSFPPSLLMDVIGKSQHLSWGWSSRFCMHSGLLLQETCLLQWVPHTYSVVYLYFQCVTSPFCSYFFFPWYFETVSYLAWCLPTLLVRYNWCHKVPRKEWHFRADCTELFPWYRITGYILHFFLCLAFSKLGDSIWMCASWKDYLSHFHCVRWWLMPVVHCLYLWAFYQLQAIRAVG